MIEFAQVKVGQRFIHKNIEYLKIPEIKKTCCQIQSNAISLVDNKKALFEYKKKVELVQ